MDQVDSALLSALVRPENQDLALNELAASAAMETVEAAVPDLVVIASRQPTRSADVADILQRLGHDAACLLLSAALPYAVYEWASPRGAAALVEMVQRSFPPALPLLRDLLLNSGSAEIKNVGRSLPAHSLHSYVERRAPVSRNRWNDVVTLGQSAGSREDLVRLFEAMSGTRAHLSETNEPSEWRHRSLHAYFRHLPPREFLALPRTRIVGKDLGEVLTDLADWFSTEPCLPLDPDFWKRAGRAYFEGTLSTAEPEDRLVVVPFVVGDALCEFYLGRDRRPYLKTGTGITGFQKLSDPRTWLDGRSPRPWRVEFAGHLIEIARQAQGWFGGLRSIGYRVYVDRRLVAYRRA